jgi:flavodoxin
MKRLFFGFLLFAGLAVAVNAQTSHKILVVYFSWSGNTRAVAVQIANELRSSETGGTRRSVDLFEIQTVLPYPDDYASFVNIIKAEQDKGTARPALATKVDNMAQYDTVFLGWPTWWGTMPMAVCTFLESYDFTGKTIYPFNSSASSGFSQALTVLKKECPASTIGDGLEVYSYGQHKNTPTLSTPDSKVTAWLEKLGFKEN